MRQGLTRPAWLAVLAWGCCRALRPVCHRAAVRHAA